MVIFRPLFRKASSRRRFDRVSNEKSVVSKIVASGLNRMIVPCFCVFSPAVSGPVGWPPFSYRWVQTLPPRRTPPPPRDLPREPLAERIDDRDADAVQTARHLVGRVLELAAGVEDGEHHLGRRFPGLLVRIDGNPAAIV